jgi:serine/threonine protein kinase/DNA-binding NarL/FixJ family response regulator
MAKQLSREEFLRNLSESGLITPEELRSALESLPDPLEPDGDTLALRLVAAGKLTMYQAKAVRERRYNELVIGNYQVLDRLGAGGMGTVYKARHRRMKRVVAIKVLTKSTDQSDKFVQRFQREVEAVARLSHPNIVLAHDADEAEVGHFLVMEFVDGKDLASIVEQRGPLPVQEAVDCILQAGRALDYAHKQGIIHRDIKPANLMRDVSGVVKVADLGLARFSEQVESAGKAASALTQAGTIMGTVDFMSPEQAMGATDIDHRTDIYSLGCTLHYLLLGRPPYEGPTLMAVLVMHREAAIPSVRKVRAEIPAALDLVFQRMVAKKPADRYPTMAEAVHALEALAVSVEKPAGVPEIRSATVAFVPSGAADDFQLLAEPSPARQPDATIADAAGARLADTAANQTIAVSPPGKPGGGTATILLVEPSRVQAAIIRKYLQEIGFQEITTASSGKQALEIIRNSPAHVVISTMHLADMTGMQLVEKMWAQQPESPPGFVIITSQSDAEEANLPSSTAHAVLLPKPFDQNQLAEALLAAMSGPSSRTCTDLPSRGRDSGKSTDPSDHGRLRVLIVDDSALARVHIRAVLKELGITQFVEAADGARAVAALASGSFDLIVTDYNMPFMDGGGLVAYLKQNPATASVPIIMVTTETDPGKLEPVRKLGVTVCDKSFQRDAVRKILDQLVGVS